MQMPPDLAQTPPTGLLRPPSVTYPSDSSVLIPNSRPFVHHPKKVSPHFLTTCGSSIDPNFVWVGRNRVPKDTLHIPVSRSTHKRNSATVYGL